MIALSTCINLTCKFHLYFLMNCFHNFLLFFLSRCLQRLLQNDIKGFLQIAIVLFCRRSHLKQLFALYSTPPVSRISTRPQEKNSQDDYYSLNRMHQDSLPPLWLQGRLSHHRHLHQPQGKGARRLPLRHR